jgi:hypothetical protein
MRNKKDVLSKERLEKLPTKRLLMYLRSLYECHEEPHWDEDTDTTELTKDSTEWKKHIQLVKSILANREHVNK